MLGSPLIFIHGFIRPTNHIIYVLVLIRVIDSYSAGYIHLLPCICLLSALLFAFFIKNTEKLFSVHVIPVHKHGNKLITADPEYRAVVKYLADDRGSLLQIYISFIVSIFVIDIL